MEEKKTKEKTRVLAHSRRQRENDTFTDIAEALPIQENAKDLDKASILRVAIHYLKLRDLVNDGDSQLQDLEGSKGENVEVTQDGPSIGDFLPNFSKDVVQALDGFLMVMSRDGRVLFVSESIANYLGLRQVDVIGVHVQDIIHPQDCSEMSTIFQTQGRDTEQVMDSKNPLRRNFVVRMRCAFTPSVRSITRCSNFKPIYCSAFLKFAQSGANKGQFLGIVALCKMASITKIRELCVGSFFKTKHSLDLSYIGVDTRIRWILGYDPSEMMGLKAYQYFHPLDLTATSSCHMNLLTNGRSYSPCYRFLTRWGDWVWCRSKSYMIFNSLSNLPDSLVILTWIVRLDEEDERMTAIQDGKSGDGLLKKYEKFTAAVTTHGGTIDVNSLTNPTGPMIDTREVMSDPVDPAPQPVTPVKPLPTPRVVSPPVAIPTSTSVIPPPLTLPVQPVLPKATTPSLSSTTSSPDSSLSDYPPNVNPFAPQRSGSLDRCSPECQSVIQGADVVDQTFLYRSHQHQSFTPSPPYTPYSQSSIKQQFDPPSCSHEGQMGSYSNFPTPSSIHSSPQQYRRSLSPSESSTEGQYCSPSALISPPYSAGLPDEIDLTSEATPFASPSFEMQGTIFATGPVSMSGHIGGYEATSLTDLQFHNQVPYFQPVSGQPSTRHTVLESGYVNQARARYHKVASAIPTGFTGQTGNEREGTRQWAQWLKGGAPAHVY